jgi:hypothetical protein
MVQEFVARDQPRTGPLATENMEGTDKTLFSHETHEIHENL